MNHHHDYRQFLRETLEDRHVRNPSYSLRAFAKQIGLSPSRLSEILNGKDSLSRKSAVKVAEKLGLTKTETDYFVALVESQSSRSALTERLPV